MAGLLKISPTVIEFPLVLRQSITSTLRLDNTSTVPVAFKIKTTAPKNYLVRPSTGVIPTQQFQEVQIILQALAQEPPQPSPDRFLVQATAAEDENSNPTREFWMNLSKSEVSDQRLTVSFQKDTNSSSSSVSSDAIGALKSVPAADVLNGVIPADGLRTSTTRHGIPQNIPTDYKQLKEKYEELVVFSQDMQGDRMRLQKELESVKFGLNQAIEEGTRRSQKNASDGPGGIKDGKGSSATAGVLPFGFEIWHLIPIIVFALIIVKLSGYL